MSDYIEITYQVEDGYVSGSRPLKVKIHLYEFDGCQTEEQVTEVIDSAVEEHMRQRVYPSWDTNQVQSILAKIKEDADE